MCSEIKVFSDTKTLKNAQVPMIFDIFGIISVINYFHEINNCNLEAIIPPCHILAIIIVTKYFTEIIPSYFLY